MQQRLLVVGWGSAEWASLHKRIEAGLMPNLRQLVERGTSATLAGARPLMTEPLFASLATGMLADQHGVLGPWQIRADGGGIEPVTRRSWLAPPFWEVLAAEGLRTLCVNWPGTRGAAGFPGVHVDPSFATPTGAGFETWTVPPDSVSPPELAERLAPLRVHPTDDLGPELLALVPRLHELDPDDRRILALRTMLARAATVHAAATQLAATEQWDALCLVYEFLHEVRSCFEHEPADGPFAEVVAQAHVLQDLMLGRLVAAAGDQATIVLVSPNGLWVRGDGRLGAQPLGTLVAAGPGIAADAILPGVDSVDIAPTLLARFGLALACDGRVADALAPAASPAPARPLPRPVADPWDPAGDLLAEGYADVLSHEQRAAMDTVARQHGRSRALASLARRDVAGAAAILESLLARFPDDQAALLLLAQCRVLSQDFAGCRSIAEALIELEPDGPWGHVLMGTWQTLEGDPELAEIDLARGRTIGADNPVVLTRLGGLALLADRADAAARDFEAAIALFPEFGEAVYGLALAQERLGNDTGAEQGFRRALALQHFQPLAQLSLASLLMRQGRFREAISRLETALAQDPRLQGAPDLLDQARARLGHGMAAAAVAGAAPAST